MMTDPIADMLTRIRNGLRVQHEAVEMPSSRVKEGIARVLKAEGFIEDYRVVGEPARRMLKVYLKYGPLGEDVIREIGRVSRPGRRVHRAVQDLGYVCNGMGIWVVSTNRGILSDRECRQLNVSGEVLCSVV
jgi:small subunit ribosomal protein S8